MCCHHRSWHGVDVEHDGRDCLPGGCVCRMSSIHQQQTPALTLEDYIGEAYVKCANIILGSRIFQNEQHKPLVDRRSGRWFLLEIDELAGLTQRLEPWRRDVYAPLIIEVSIRPWDTSAVMPGDSSSQPAAHAAGTAAGAAPGGSMLLERWTLCFAPGVNSSGNSRASMDTAAVYKRLILLIRSLYSYVRVLPAYRMYRACKRHGGELFNTTYSLSTTADPSMQPIHPWPQQQQMPGSAAAAGGSNGNGGRMCQFAFTPVETLGGAFSIHVEYQPATTVHILEQTTIPVSMPRIIADYVDSPYARSAPNAAAGAISKQAAGRAVSRMSGPEGPLALLRASQHHTPLVRHSWSSRDVSGPTVVQRSFSPVGNTSAHPQQQHRRTSSQGSGSGPPMSPAASGQSPVQAAAGSSSSSWGRPPLPHGASSLHASSQSLAAAAAAGHGLAAAGPGYSSSLPSGYSALMGSVQGSSGLPPASPVTPSGGGRSPLFRSSSLSTAAAIGAGGGAAAPTAAAPGAQQPQVTISRLGTSPTLLQHLRQHQQHPRPPVQPLSPQSTQQGFHVKPAQAQQVMQVCAPQHSEPAPVPVPAGAVGEAGSSAPAGTAFAVADDSSSSSEQGKQVGTAGAGTHLQQHLEQQGSSDDIGSHVAAGAAAEELPCASRAQDAAAAVDGGAVVSEPLGTGDSCRAASAPVTIPYSKAKGVRARSVSDLTKLDAATAPAAAAHPPQLPQPGDDPNQAATAGEQGPAAVDTSVVTGPPAVNTRPIGGVAAGLSSMAGGVKSSSSSGLLKVHEQHLQQQQQVRQQQLVQAPSSAPAAPRGMLGQLLSAGSGPTSPAFSPRSSAAQRGSGSRVVAAAMAAAAAAAGGAREAYHACHAHPAAAAAAERGRHVDSGDDSDSSGTSSAADGVLSSTPTPRGAIIIRPNPLMHMQHAPAPASASVTAAGGTAATSGSPGGSSSCGSQPNSVGSRVLGRRVLAGQVFVGPGSVGSGPVVGVGSGPYLTGLGVQPNTPTAPHSYLGSSPQLPFAFTPSAASLGTSLMSLADAQRQMMAPGGTTGSGTSAAPKQLPAPLSRPGAAAAAAAASAAAGIAAAGAAGAGSPSATAVGRGTGTGPAAGPASGSAGTALSSAVPVGTPSPPLLYPPASGGQVSFIRDISGLATIRRPSWSSRSSSFDIAAAGSATLPHHLSMSPGMADLMDPSLMLGYSSSHGSSAPGVASLRNAAAGGSSSSAAAAPGVVYRWNLGQQPGASIGPQMHLQQSQQQGSEGDFQHQQQQEEGARQAGQSQENSDAAAGSAQVSTGDLQESSAGLEAAAHAGDAAMAGSDAQGAAGPAAAGGAGVDASGSGAPVEDAFGGSMGHDESESDLLPFVLDAEPLGPMQGVGHAGPGAGQYGGPGAGGTLGQAGRIAATAGAVAGVAGAAAAGTGGVAEAQRDVAVGAFLRMVQEAAAAPVGRLDRRQGMWTQQQQRQQGELGAASAEMGLGSAPVCLGDAVHQVQELAGQLQQLLFPEPYA